MCSISHRKFNFLMQLPLPSFYKKKLPPPIQFSNDAHASEAEFILPYNFKFHIDLKYWSETDFYSNPLQIVTCYQYLRPPGVRWQDVFPA